MNTSHVHRPVMALTGLLAAAALLSACGDLPSGEAGQGAALLQAQALADARHERSVSAQADRLTAQARAHAQRPGSERSLSAQSARLTAQARAHLAGPADPASAALIEAR
jgi:hypothetical protein